MQGAGLHQMARFGLRVPPGFTLTTEACGLITAATATSTTSIADMEAQLPQSLWEQLEEGLLWLETVSGAPLGGQASLKTADAVAGPAAAGGSPGQPAQGSRLSTAVGDRRGTVSTLLVSVRSGAYIGISRGPEERG